MIAQNFNRSSAMQIVNRLVTPIKDLLAISIVMARDVMNAKLGTVKRYGGLVVTKLSRDVVQLTTAGKSFYLTIRNGLTIIDSKDGEPEALNSRRSLHSIKNGVVTISLAIGVAVLILVAQAAILSDVSIQLIGMVGMTAAANQLSSLVKWPTIGTVSDAQLGRNKKAFEAVKADDDILARQAECGHEYEHNDDDLAPGVPERFAQIGDVITRFFDILQVHGLNTTVAGTDRRIIEVVRTHAPVLSFPTDFTKSILGAHLGISGQFLFRRSNGDLNQALRVYIREPQFFGETDFEANEFKINEVIRIIARYIDSATNIDEVPTLVRLIISGLAKENTLSISAVDNSDTLSIDVLRRQLQMLRQQDLKQLRISFAKIVNGFLGNPNFMDDLGDNTYDRIAEIGMMRNQVSQVQESGLGNDIKISATRQLNRATIELFFPAETRLTRGDPNERLNQWLIGVINATNPFAQVLIHREWLGINFSGGGVVYSQNSPLKKLEENGGRSDYIRSAVETAQSFRDFSKKLIDWPLERRWDYFITLAILYLLHESTHAFSNHIPVAKSTGDSKKKWDGRKLFAFNQFLKLYASSDSPFAMSATGQRVTIKALEPMVAEVIETQSNNKLVELIDQMDVARTVESICDRFPVFFLFNYTKLQIYRKILEELKNQGQKELPKLDSVEDMMIFEKKIIKIIESQSNESSRIEQEIKDAQGSHALVAIGDPELDPRETELYSMLWKMLARFSEEKKMGRLKREHADISPIVRFSKEREFVKG